MRRVYMDYAATTPINPGVIEKMLPYLYESFGNPSTIYSCGQQARKAIDDARVQVAGLIGADTREIVFTSGGTESDNMAIKGIAFACEKKGKHIITSSIEHHAVIETCKALEKRGWQISYLPVDRNGVISLEQLRDSITAQTVLISIMHANNEIGTVQPIDEIGKIARAAGVYFHCDGVQTAGHIPIDVYATGVDLLSISSHKLYGPKGVGALYVKKGTPLKPLIHGGGQEGNRRSGTENVAGIVGFGEAAHIAKNDIGEECTRLTRLRDYFIHELSARINSIHLNGHPGKRLPGNINISVDYVEGESMLLNLDAEGICASTGSACSSGSLEPSHVLLAIGLSHERAHGSLRFTLGKWTTKVEIDFVLDVLPGIVDKLRAMSPLAPQTIGERK